MSIEAMISLFYLPLDSKHPRLLISKLFEKSEATSRKAKRKKTSYSGINKYALLILLFFSHKSLFRLLPITM
jgi:hypothetical protein